MSSTDTYLVAATTVTPGPTSARIRSSRSRIASGDETDDTLRSADRALAAVREEPVGVAARAEVDAVDGGDARAAQRALGRGPQVEHAAARQVGVEPLRDLGSDLVAARADRRPDGGREPAAAERGDGRVDDPL